MKDIHIDHGEWIDICGMRSKRFKDIELCTKIELMRERIDEGLYLVGWLYGDRVYLRCNNTPVDLSNSKWIKKKCECGAEKCKTTHATWCPMY